MEKYSVKKPFTVMVAVIAVIVLGFVSMTRITTDLLPQISLPYLLVITPYPGASPEKVETEVSRPMENALGTISNVENVNSVSSENFSMVQLEFTDGTNMDSAMVKVSSAVDQVSGSLPDSCPSPTIMEISMDMIATMYIGIEREGYDVYQLSDYVNEEVIPYIERQEGIGSISVIGTVDRTVEVRLNKEKITGVNNRLRREAESKMQDAQSKLDEAKEKVESGLSELQSQESSFGDTLASGVFSALKEPAKNAADTMKGAIGGMISKLQDVKSAMAGLNNAAETVKAAVADAQAAYDSAQEDVETAQKAMETAQSQYDEAVAALADAGEEAEEEVITGLTEAVAQAQEALDLAASDLTAAQEKLQEAANTLSETASQAAQTIDTANLEERIDEIISGLSDAYDNLNGDSITNLLNGVTKISQLVPQIQSAMSQLSAADTGGQLADPIGAVESALGALSTSMDKVPDVINGMQEIYAGLTQAQLTAAVGFSTAASQLTTAQTQLQAAQKQLEDAREKVLKSANLDALLSVDTLSSMIYAQNFAMPAGYVDDEAGNSWLLKVGDEYDDSEDIAGALLCDIEGVGTIRLEDVADIRVVDNADKSYARLNGSPAILLSIYKSSAAGTNEVSRNVGRAISELEARDEGLHAATLMDQGSYITMIVSDIVKSMAIGALLAIIILALFLRDFRPTVVVGISIPLSVLFAIVLMYFAGLTLNMMTLSGLSLGIGMLVDNSIVVMENIFRLRGRGLPAPRAAVQGTKQVTGAIIASTLTTVCVFLPMIFTSGTVRELLVPMALSISFCLLASLVVAMSVVPASGSTILRRVTPKENRFMDRVQESYGKSLRWCLRHKLPVLGAAAGLLILCGIRLIMMGIVILPEMSGDDIQVTIVTPEEDTREESYAKVDKVMEAVMGLEDVESVGIMDQSSTAGLLTSGLSSSSSDSWGSYLCYVNPSEGVDFSSRVDEICDEIMEATKDIDAEITASTGGMSDMGSLMASGLTISIYGKDMEKMEEIREDIAEIVRGTEGFVDVNAGEEDQEEALHLIIDKDKAMSYGLTVAQIYAEISGRLKTSVTSTNISSGGMSLDVVILDETDPLTRENLMDMEFEPVSLTDASASQTDMSSMSALTGDDEDEDEEEEETSHKLREFATLETTTSPSSLNRRNLTSYVTVTASVSDGYNLSLLSRDLQKKLDAYKTPYGYSVVLEGETSQINEMLVQMIKLMLLALLFIYLVMVSQFQSLLSPFIVMFTIPLAFTGGMIGLILFREQLSMLAMMGFLILMGTVVNNGIVFVDYANQLRQGGMERQDALVATGRTRMRPIMMTALTTILAMMGLVLGKGMGSQMGRGMAIVISVGLLYATLMTLYIVPLLYDILFKRQPLTVDTGDDLDEAPDDAQQFIEEMRREREEQEEARASSEDTSAEDTSAEDTFAENTSAEDTSDHAASGNQK